ncbi:MAG: ribonuclease III [Terriglobales bacterium]
MKARDIKELERAIGHRFKRRELVEQALTHSSHARELENQSTADSGPVRVPDNEQMEFLGDAVLGFVTSQELFERFPQFHEGQLSKLRAHLVSQTHLIRAARLIHVGRYLRLGRGEEKSGGRTKTTLQVDALEALLAAMYLDTGLEKTRAFILEKIVEPELRRLKKQVADGLPITDFKSALQEAAHSASRPQPSYILVKEEGPEHKKKFTVEARLYGLQGGKPEYVGRGEGSTKKMAEQDAAQQALKYLWSLNGKPKKSRSVASK